MRSRTDMTEDIEVIDLTGSPTQEPDDSDDSSNDQPTDALDGESTGANNVPTKAPSNGRSAAFDESFDKSSSQSSNDSPDQASDQSADLSADLEDSIDSDSADAIDDINEVEEVAGGGVRHLDVDENEREDDLEDSIDSESDEASDEASDVAISHSRRRRKYRINCKIEGLFFYGTWLGEVVAQGVDSGGLWFQIVYKDGDSEILYFEEMEEARVTRVGNDDNSFSDKFTLRVMTEGYYKGAVWHLEAGHSGSILFGKNPIRDGGVPSTCALAKMSKSEDEEMQSTHAYVEYLPGQGVRVIDKTEGLTYIAYPVARTQEVEHGWAQVGDSIMIGGTVLKVERRRRPL
jgi:hypothetical protein